jgi:hypothetical protein
MWNAEVVELVDTQVSGTCGSNPVGVRVPPSAFHFLLVACCLWLVAGA